MRRYKAVVEYDGSAYYGFQRQTADQITIQSELERALRVIAHSAVSVIGAGRTDSGVHASGQVVAFDMRWRHGTQALQNAINANLARDVAVRSIESVSAEFHPRFDARRRAYVYTIYNAPVRSPLSRQRSWHVRQPLDMDKMNQAAALLIGVHDFATFGQPPQGTITVREVFSAEWTRQEPFLTFRIEANAFLYRMVRSIVGTLKAVGDGSRTVDEFAAALVAAERSRAGQTAPAHGLVLAAVTYSA